MILITILNFILEPFFFFYYMKQMYEVRKLTVLKKEIYIVCTIFFLFLINLISFYFSSVFWLEYIVLNFAMMISISYLFETSLWNKGKAMIAYFFLYFICMMMKSAWHKISLNSDLFINLYFFHQNTAYWLLTLGMQYLYLYSLIRFILLDNKKSENFKCEIRKIRLYSFALFLVIWLFMWIGAYMQVERGTAMLLLLTIFIFSNFQVASVSLLEKTLMKQRLDTELKLLQMQYQNSEEKYALMLANNDKIRAYRHDFKHYIKGYLSMLEEGKIEELKEELKNELTQFQTEVNDTCDANLNLVLSEQKETIEKLKIEMVLEIWEQLPLSSIESCIIYGNLISNAIESCVRSEVKKIEIIVKRIENYVAIKMTNSCDEYRGLETTKKDKNMHGIGLRSIEKIVSSKNGKINYSYDTNKKIFVTTIFISWD